MLGRGVNGVCGSCLRPRHGVLAPDVDIKGLPLTEPLPYMKIGTKQIKNKKGNTRQTQRHVGIKQKDKRQEGVTSHKRKEKRKRESLDKHSQGKEVVKKQLKQRCKELENQNTVSGKLEQKESEH